MGTARTIVLEAGDQPFPVVFEMGGFTIVVPVGRQIRLVVTGPKDAELTIGHGANGVSVFRDLRLKVKVYGVDGSLVEIPGFARTSAGGEGKRRYTRPRTGPSIASTDG